MIFRNPIWLHILFDEDGAGGGGGGESEGGEGDKGGGGAPPASIFSQLAQHFDDPKEREGFEGWSKRYTSDKERLKAINSMRTSFDQRVKLPGPDDKPEDVDKFWQKLGVPPTAKEYQVDLTGVELDDSSTARLEGFKEVARKLRLTNEQVNGLFKYNQETEGSLEEVVTEQVNAFQDKTDAFLKKEWGADYEANFGYTKAAVQQFADSPEAWKGFADMTIIGKEGSMRVGDHPVLITMLARIGRMFGEDERAREMEVNGEAATLQQKIQEIQQEAIKAGKMPREEPYHSRLAPLYAKLHPAKRKGTTY